MGMETYQQRWAVSQPSQVRLRLNAVRGFWPLLLLLTACAQERTHPRIADVTAPLHVSVRVVDVEVEKQCSTIPAFTDKVSCWFSKSARDGCTYVSIGESADLPIAFTGAATIAHCDFQRMRTNTAILMFKTKAGLRVLACGENPAAAESVGINVTRYRYAMVTASAVLAALGGAYLSIGDLSQFSTNMTAGRGFIALAAVIFGNWMPWATMWAALLFGFAQALRYQVQALDLPISQDIIIALPYLLTLIAVTGLFRQSTPPAGLGKHASSG